MNLIKCFMTNSTWYKSAVRNSKPVGILWHDTGAGNSTLKRYVQPHENDTNYQELITLLGKNKYSNDWNHITHQAGLNAWIGKLADGSVATVQTGDWTMTPWGCGGGKYGSCNGYTGNVMWQGVHWIQFEICDDGYGNKQYFDQVYKEACELTAYLCEKFNIDPNGTVNFNGVEIPTILCHADSYELGVGNNHIDVTSWFKRYGYGMESVRKDVAKLLKQQSNSVPPEKTITFDILDTVKIKEGVTTYANGKTIPSWVCNTTLYVRAINGNNVTISTLTEGDITGIVRSSDLTLVKKNSLNSNQSEKSDKDLEGSTSDEKDSTDVVEPDSQCKQPENESFENADKSEDNQFNESSNIIEDDVLDETTSEPETKLEDLISEEDKVTLGNKFSELISFILLLIKKLFK